MTPGDTIVRAPNHLGDVIMALPAIADAGHDVMVIRSLAPILDMAGLPIRVLPLDRGLRGFGAAARRLRSDGYRRGYLLTPAFSAAALFRAGGVSWIRGTRGDGRTPLLSDGVSRKGLSRRHRILQYRLLLDQPADGPPANLRITPPEDAVRRWTDELSGTDDPVIAFFPGSNAPARRWPAESFAALGRRLASDGARIVVLGGPAETGLTATVAAGIPAATDAGGRTDLAGLAAVLSLCDVLVSNDTGPMHLAGVVGATTVTLWGSSDPHEVHPVGAADLQLAGPRIPCMPCKKNECPRSGRGTILDDADTECMRLIAVEPVHEAVRKALGIG